MSRRPALSMVSTRSDDTPDTPGVVVRPAAPPTATGSGGVVAELTGGDTSSPLSIASIPAPYAPSEGATLTDQERAHLETCERAVAGLQRAFAVAGKALATINQARLYRETHKTFTDYLADRWSMSESQAYRLMDAWPVYAQLEAAGVTVLNERQARELVASFRRHGGPATVALAKAVEKYARRPTAAMYEAARKALPAQLPQDPYQLERTVEEVTVRVLPRAASPNGGETAASSTSPNGGETAGRGVGQAEAEGDITRDQVEAGAEAMATLEAAVAQQRQIYDRIGGGVLAAARLYDPGRADYLCRELRQYANRTSYRAGKLTEGDES